MAVKANDRPLMHVFQIGLLTLHIKASGYNPTRSVFATIVNTKMLAKHEEWLGSPPDSKYTYMYYSTDQVLNTYFYQKMLESLRPSDIKQEQTKHSLLGE